MPRAIQREEAAKVAGIGARCRDDENRRFIHRDARRTGQEIVFPIKPHKRRTRARNERRTCIEHRLADITVIARAIEPDFEFAIRRERHLPRGAGGVLRSGIEPHCECVVGRELGVGPRFDGVRRNGKDGCEE